MNNNSLNNVKVGMMVIASLLILILSLYMIGRDQSMFGSRVEARARFRNINGLRAGNNVRFAGIQAGSVKKINILNDTTIEVVIYIDKKVKPYIKKNSWVAIGTEGLMGNKVMNIYPAAEPSAEIEDGDLLVTKKETSTDEMLTTLAQTNIDAGIVASDLKLTIKRLNNLAVWSVLNDTATMTHIKSSFANVYQASDRINEITGTLNQLIREVQQGKGPAGILLKDQQVSNDMKHIVQRLNDAAGNTATLTARLDTTIRQLQVNADNSPSNLNRLLHDTGYIMQLNRSLDNIEKGTAAFNEDMQALRHNFLFRKYFRKQEKKKNNSNK